MAHTPPEPTDRQRRRSSRPALTAREVRFCRHYAEHGNATQAYQDAGYPPGTPSATGVKAHRLLKNVKVRQQIRDFQQAAADAAKVSVEVVAAGLSRIAQADRRKLFGPDGEMLPPHLWPDDIAAAVVGVEVEQLTELVADPANPRRKKKVAIGERWKVKTDRRTDAWKALGHWLGMFGKDQTTTSGGVIEVTKAKLPDNERDTPAEG